MSKFSEQIPQNLQWKIAPGIVSTPKGEIDLENCTADQFEKHRKYLAPFFTEKQDSKKATAAS